MTLRAYSGVNDGSVSSSASDAEFRSITAIGRPNPVGGPGAFVPCNDGDGKGVGAAASGRAAVFDDSLEGDGRRNTQ